MIKRQGYDFCIMDECLCNCIGNKIDNLKFCPKCGKPIDFICLGEGAVCKRCKSVFIVRDPRIEAEIISELRELQRIAEESYMAYMDRFECCGNCKYNSCSGRDKFYCGNKESDNYGTPTAYDDVCEDYEDKEED